MYMGPVPPSAAPMARRLRLEQEEREQIERERLERGHRDEIEREALKLKAELAALRTALLAAERVEEVLIEGSMTARRPDADPRAVLGIAFVGAAAMAA